MDTNLVWTPELAYKANQEGWYLHVPDGKIWELLDADSKWEDNPYILYHPGYRIAGTMSEIRSALMKAGVNDRDIDAVLATAISESNYTNTMKNIYDQDLARDKQKSLRRKNMLRRKVRTIEFKAKSLEKEEAIFRRLEAQLKEERSHEAQLKEERSHEAIRVPFGSAITKLINIRREISRQIFALYHQEEYMEFMRNMYPDSEDERPAEEGEDEGED